MHKGLQAQQTGLHLTIQILFKFYLLAVAEVAVELILHITKQVEAAAVARYYSKAFQ
jgi:hypothetical protein